MAHVGVLASQGSHLLSDAGSAAVPCPHRRVCRGAGPRREGSRCASCPVLQLTSPAGQGSARAPAAGSGEQGREGFFPEKQWLKGARSRGDWRLPLKWELLDLEDTWQREGGYGTFCGPWMLSTAFSTRDQGGSWISSEGVAGAAAF